MKKTLSITLSVEVDTDIEDAKNVLDELDIKVKSKRVYVPYNGWRDAIKVERSEVVDYFESNS